MDLLKALRLSTTPRLALVGAGGKTTALFQLARQLSGEQHLPVIVTATSHLHVNQTGLADSHWIASEPADLNNLEAHLEGVILVSGPIEADRSTGLNGPTLDWLLAFSNYHDLPMLIEADGSRQKPLKAPTEHEPPIPAFVDTVVVVAGLSGLGKPLNAEQVHRPDVFGRLSGLAEGEPVNPQALAKVMLHPEGGLKNIPARARKVALLNQADTPENQAQAKAIAEQLLPAYDAVLIASLSISVIHAVIEPIAAILLAAGAARRFGAPKQLLQFKGEPFVRVVARTAISAGVDPVVVVTGANATEVSGAVQDLPVHIVYNEAWDEGQSSSIKKGLTGLPLNTGACYFLLADQPQITPPVLRALQEAHARTLAAVIAPQVGGQRANPVLFDRVTFPSLSTLNGDMGGRQIFSKYPPQYLPWHDESLLVDIDTPADLQKLEGLGNSE